MYLKSLAKTGSVFLVVINKSLAKVRVKVKVGKGLPAACDEGTRAE